MEEVLPVPRKERKRISVPGGPPGAVERPRGSAPPAPNGVPVVLPRIPRPAPEHHHGGQSGAARAVCRVGPAEPRHRAPHRPAFVSYRGSGRGGRLGGAGPGGAGRIPEAQTGTAPRRSGERTPNPEPHPEPPGGGGGDRTAGRMSGVGGAKGRRDR